MSQVHKPEAGTGGVFAHDDRPISLFPEFQQSGLGAAELGTVEPDTVEPDTVELDTAELNTLAPPIRRFWQPVNSISLRQINPNVKFMAWDFDQSIANMEPLHHQVFRTALIQLIQKVDLDFSKEAPRFQPLWRFARRGFGLQEMDTIKVITKAIAFTDSSLFNNLLIDAAYTLPPALHSRIVECLMANEGAEPAAQRLENDDFQAVEDKVRRELKRLKDAAVRDALDSEDLKIRVIPGAINLLRRGKEAGFLIGLATGSPRTFVEPILEKLGLLSFFDATVYNDDESILSDAQRKPGPFPYQELTRRLQQVYKGPTPLRPDNGVAFEDSLTGIRSAHAAGIPVIARPPSLPWLFKKLLAPSGEFSGHTFQQRDWERRTREKRAALLHELSERSGTGLDKIYLLFQDVTDPQYRQTHTRANRQQLTWDNVEI